MTRRGKNGVVRERGSGFVAAAYQHRTSRAQDPHLHTHVIVANMTKTPSDGEWRALDGEPILKQLPARGRLPLPGPAAVRADPLARGRVAPAGERDGGDRRRPATRRCGRSRSGGRRCSTTSSAAAARASTPPRSPRSRPATARSRSTCPRLREEWQARAAEHGLGRRELRRVLDRALVRELDEHAAAEVTAQLVGPDGLTAKRSTFSDPDAVMAWAQAHTQGAPVERVLSLVGRFLGIEPVAPIAPAAVGRPALFSTAELLRHERAALALAARGRQVRVPVVSTATVERVAHDRGPLLGREQVAMLRAVASSPDRVVCVVGHAGAGKTTALAALADAFRRDGYVAIGAAPSGVAAANLAAESGIPSGTLHRLLAEARQRGGLPRRCLLVVDEAGMADTRTLTDALFQVEHAAGKAVLVGDPAQLPAVGAGGLYAAIVARNGAVELHDNRRQRDELERSALALAARRAKPRLPRPRRRAGQADGCRQSHRGEGAAARRLVAGRPHRPSGQCDDRLPSRRRRRAQRGRPHAPRP